MKEVGKFLKKEREKQGLELEDLADRTKIHIQKLVDIESGNRESLPAKVFCIGLIKSYGRELKVDMDQLSQLINAAFQEAKPVIESLPVTPIESTPDPAKMKAKKKASAKPAPKKTTPNDDEANQMVGRFKVPKILMIAGSGILSLVLLFVIFQVVDKMNAYQKEEALPKEVFVTDETISEKPVDAGLNETLDAVENETPLPDPISTPPLETDKSSTQAVQKAEPAVDVKPAPEEPPQITEDPKASSDNETGADFSDDNFGGPAGQSADVVSDNKLTITALEPVRAEVIWSDGYVQVMLLKSKETKTLVFSKPITLRVNNGGAIQVSFNDSENQVPGTFNKPIEIQYP